MDRAQSARRSPCGVNGSDQEHGITRFAPPSPAPGASTLLDFLELRVCTGGMQDHRDRRVAAIAPEPAVFAIERSDEHTLIRGLANALHVAVVGRARSVGMGVGVH